MNYTYMVFSLVVIVGAILVVLVFILLLTQKRKYMKVNEIALKNNMTKISVTVSHLYGYPSQRWSYNKSDLWFNDDFAILYPKTIFGRLNSLLQYPFVISDNPHEIGALTGFTYTKGFDYINFSTPLVLIIKWKEKGILSLGTHELEIKATNKNDIAAFYTLKTMKFFKTINIHYFNQ